MEIENSFPENNLEASSLKNETPIIIENEDKVGNFIGASKTNPVIENKNQEKKISPLQTLIAKKIAKKANSGKVQRLDKNLKFAIIFGAIGLTLMLFGYPIWLVGAIIFIVGVVFLLLWVVEQ